MTRRIVSKKPREVPAIVPVRTSRIVYSTGARFIDGEADGRAGREIIVSLPRVYWLERPMP